MKIKHRMASYMRKKMEHTKVYDFLVKLNQVVFHYNLRECHKKFGDKNPNKVFYVIRGRALEAGLFGLYGTTLNEMYRAMKMNWIPVVDYRGECTQYNVDFPIRGNIWNAWEYYFEQPVKEYSLDEVYRSKNVVLSGWRFFKRPEWRECIWDSDKILDTKEFENIHAFVNEYGKMNEDIISIINEEKKRVFEDRCNILGVSVRGTDYIAFKPKGHCVQPPLEDVIKKVKDYLNKYENIDGLFLTTEDDNIYLRFKKEFGEIVFTSNSNRIQNYAGESYITTQLRKNNKYEQGLEYLVEKTLLAKCKYLIATRTAGADFALVMNNNQYTEKYVFDLGKY